MNRNTDTDDWPTGYDRFQALMKKLEEATDGMQTLTTKVEGLTTTVGELTTKVDDLTTTVRDLSTKVEAHSDKVGDLSTEVKGQGNKVSEIKQMMTTKIDDLNHTLTPKIDGLTTKIKDPHKAQGDLIKKVSCEAKLRRRCTTGLVSPTLADLWGFTNRLKKLGSAG
jgi:uncharacterized protein YoxC